MPTDSQLASRELRARIHTRFKRLHFNVREDIYERIMAKRKAAQRSKIIMISHRKEWSALFAPLKQEINTLVTMQKYVEKAKPPRRDHAARMEAYALYASVLQEVLRRLNEAYVYAPKDLQPNKKNKTGRMTPAQYVKHLGRNAKFVPTNNGAHWVDWVPEKIKRRVMHAWAQLMPPVRGKNKVVFDRVTPLKQAEKARERLKQATLTEQHKLYRTLNVCDDKDERNPIYISTSTQKLKDKIELMHKAQAVLASLPDNAALPRTWHGLIGLTVPERASERHERRMRIEKKHRNALRQRTRAEQQKADSANIYHPSDQPLQLRLAFINTALKKLDLLDEVHATEPTPKTWQELMQAELKAREERGELLPDMR